LTISDVDTTDTVSADRTLVVSGTSNRSNAAAPSDGELLAMLTLTPMTPADVLDGTENSDTLTWTFDSGGEAFDYLSIGQTLVLTYTITVTDSQGATDSETVTITITGTNDTPVLVDTDLNIIRNVTAREIHNAISEGPDIPDMFSIDFNQSVVEGEHIELSFTIEDPDNGESVQAILYLTTRDAYNEAMSNNQRLDAADPRVVRLDSDSDLSKTGILFESYFSAQIIDDFPVGTPVDELIFVLEFEDSQEALVHEPITEDGFPSMDPVYQFFNYTPLIFDPSTIPAGTVPPEILSLPGISRIDFELQGSEFVSTVTGFVLETGDAITDPLLGTIFNAANGDVLIDSLIIEPTGMLNLDTTTIDSDGVTRMENATVGRFFTVTIRVPLSSDLVSMSGTVLNGDFQIADNDGGASILRDLQLRFPALVITVPLIEEVEEVSEPVLEEIRVKDSQALNVVKPIVQLQIPLSNKIESDTFEVLVRIVIDDGVNPENSDPLYQYIDLFKSDDALEDDENQTIEQARNRLEQFLNQVSQLPDNRYQVILRQKRGDLKVSDTVILDVIVKDGQIIELQEQSLPLDQNNNQRSEIDTPESVVVPVTANDTIDLEKEQTPTRAEVALTAAAVSGLINRSKRGQTDRRDHDADEKVKLNHEQKRNSLWTTLYRIGSKK